MTPTRDASTIETEASHCGEDRDVDPHLTLGTPRAPASLPAHVKPGACTWASCPWRALEHLMAGCCHPFQCGGLSLCDHPQSSAEVSMSLLIFKITPRAGHLQAGLLCRHTASAVAEGCPLRRTPHLV